MQGSYTSLPFGDGYQATGADEDPYHFAALDQDSESDTGHAQFRQYNNTQGRWHTPDPYSGSYDFSNPQSFNRYVYAMNNPLAAVDPSGLYEIVCDFNGNCGIVSDNDWAKMQSNLGDGISIGADGTIYCQGVGACGSAQYVPDGSGVFAVPSSSGGGGGAPSNIVAQTLQLLPKALSCHASAFKKEGIALATDAIGAIPGEGNGLRIGQLVAGGVGFVNGLVNSDAAGSVGNVLIGQTTLVGWGAQSVGATALEAVPVIGNFASAGFAVRDLINEAQDAYACMGGN